MAPVSDQAPVSQNDKKIEVFYKALNSISESQYYLYSKHIKRITEHERIISIPMPKLEIHMHAFMACMMNGMEHITGADITKLLDKLGETPYQEFLDSISSEYYANYLVYLSCISVIEFSPTGLTSEVLLKLVTALGLEPNIKAAEEVIQVSRAVRSSSSYVEYLILSQSGPYEPIYLGLKAIMDAQRHLAIERIDQIAKSQDIMSLLDSGILPYMFTDGAIAFTGKKATRQKIRELMAIVGFKVNHQYLDIVAARNYRNPAPYGGIAALLSAAKKELTPEAIIDFGSVLNILPDEELAKDVIKAFDAIKLAPAH